jgi:hypothetical protein
MASPRYHRERWFGNGSDSLGFGLAGDGSVGRLTFVFDFMCKGKILLQVLGSMTPVDLLGRQNQEVNDVLPDLIPSRSQRPANATVSLE